MFDPASRYEPIPTAEYPSPDGRTIVYKRRRFLPQGDAMPVLVEVRVGVSDRLDTIAARTLGDPLQFWQVCDANNAMDPFKLAAEPGRSLRVPIPRFQESPYAGGPAEKNPVDAAEGER